MLQEYGEENGDAAAAQTEIRPHLSNLQARSVKTRSEQQVTGRLLESRYFLEAFKSSFQRATKASLAGKIWLAREI